MNSDGVAQPLDGQRWTHAHTDVFGHVTSGIYKRERDKPSYPKMVHKAKKKQRKKVRRR